ncbi:hypothetical protein [Devosia sp. 1635]|uniref:hypothetical protein n=1 Tax=Devosia sp. 1635 TaxID=2726066 RepID=UPI0015631981|nr:hypothetical protein [Devosia sp. 1635]
MVQLMMRGPSIPKLKPALIGMVEDLIGPGVGAEEDERQDKAGAQAFLDELDRKADGAAKRK